jgi:hypothetical protein
MVLILGRPGVGKTRFAGTFPNPYFLDLEEGAATAHPGTVLRAVLPLDDRQILAKTKAFIRKVGKCPARDGGLVIEKDGGEHVVRTLVVDSVDALQQAVMDFQILREGKFKMERGDWGTLLNAMRPVNMLLRSLPIHVVVTAHTKTRDGEQNRPGVMDLAVQGALRDQMPRWYDAILHIGEKEEGKRFVVCQPTIFNRSRWLAKDRHDALRPLWDTGSKPKPVISLPAPEGWPTREIAEVLCGNSES